MEQRDWRNAFTAVQEDLQSQINLQKEKGEVFKSLVQTLLTSIEKTTNRIEEVDRYAVKSKNQLYERIKAIEEDLLEVVSGGNTDPRKLFESYEATI